MSPDLGIHPDDAKGQENRDEHARNHGRPSQPGAEVLDEERIVGEIEEFTHGGSQVLEVANLECGENRRFGIFLSFWHARKKKKNTKAAILAALQICHDTSRAPTLRKSSSSPSFFRPNETTGTPPATMRVSNALT